MVISPVQQMCSFLSGHLARLLPLTVVSPLTPDLILGAGVDGAVDAVAAAADRKHEANDAKCDALGWQCVPLAVDSYGRWGVEAHKSFAQIATHIQTRNGGSLSAAYGSVYNTLGVVDSSQRSCSTCTTLEL